MGQQRSKVAECSSADCYLYNVRPFCQLLLHSGEKCRSSLSHAKLLHIISKWCPFHWIFVPVKMSQHLPDRMSLESTFLFLKLIWWHTQVWHTTRLVGRVCLGVGRKCSVLVVINCLLLVVSVNAGRMHPFAICPLRQGQSPMQLLQGFHIIVLMSLKIKAFVPLVFLIACKTCTLNYCIELYLPFICPIAKYVHIDLQIVSPSQLIFALSFVSTNCYL